MCFVIRAARRKVWKGGGGESRCICAYMREGEVEWLQRVDAEEVDEFKYQSQRGEVCRPRCGWKRIAGVICNNSASVKLTEMLPDGSKFR